MRNFGFTIFRVKYHILLYIGQFAYPFFLQKFAQNSKLVYKPSEKNILTFKYIAKMTKILLISYSCRMIFNKIAQDACLTI